MDKTKWGGVDALRTLVQALSGEVELTFCCRPCRLRIERTRFQKSVEGAAHLQEPLRRSLRAGGGAAAARGFVQRSRAVQIFRVWAGDREVPQMELCFVGIWPGS